jgi:hypothetical protein
MDDKKCTTCGGKKYENPFCSNSFHLENKTWIQEEIDEARRIGKEWSEAFLKYAEEHPMVKKGV